MSRARIANNNSFGLVSLLGNPLEIAKTFRSYRWKEGLRCPYCGSKNVIKWCVYQQIWQRYRCKECGKTFNDKTGSILHYKHLSLGECVLFFALFIYLHLSVRGIARLLDRSPLTIYDLAKRVMKILVSVYCKREPLVGQIEIDEVYICNGLKGRNNRKMIEAANRLPRRRGKRGKRGRGSYDDDKVPVVALYERGDKRFLMEAFPRLNENVAKFIGIVVAPKSTIYTDEYPTYINPCSSLGYDHQVVVHSKRRYAEKEASVNGCESLFSLLRLFLSVHRGSRNTT